MPQKFLELPPEVARAFVRDMKAFFACGHDTIKEPTGSPRCSSMR